MCEWGVRGAQERAWISVTLLNKISSQSLVKIKEQQRAYRKCRIM